ncbi:hypothetical protein QYE76_021748 [Lolium multiflorum]|uniref:TF-B3 domain-containing protein n=1 Tax=Lolium multiflorum TaxID=4521 RepID=A0AAD8R8G9_LOLMU|nr:hypothetical protein QYE76_021748 [Lolium multiflorum]
MRLSIGSHGEFGGAVAASAPGNGSAAVRMICVDVLFLGDPAGGIGGVGATDLALFLWWSSGFSHARMKIFRRLEGRASRTASGPWEWAWPWSPRKKWWERPESAATIPVTTAIATIVAPVHGHRPPRFRVWRHHPPRHELGQPEVRLASIIDGQDPHHVLLRVSGGATGLWSAEVMFDDVGHMFLQNDWRHFARSHAIEVGHFVIFKYDGHNVFTVKVFDETMCHRH